ncbi:MAG: flagellar hook-basal body complex protein FliE [Vallitaleaceae bacterium]|nr:flagellar hook-basal body complex protein FliE [Vallitaleaceae bacterium]
MDIKSISQVATKMPSISLPSSEEKESVFSQIYQSAIQMLNETNTLNHQADQMSLDFAIGKIDNIHEVMIAQEKASVALQYTVQIKNAVLEAYNDIMRLQM